MDDLLLLRYRILFLILGFTCAISQTLNQYGTQWAPVLEWEVENSTYSGSGFDLIATAIFVHSTSDDTIATLMYFDSTASEQTFKFRFTATRTGVWTVQTHSVDADLNGLTGMVTIDENPDAELHGFLMNFGGKWGWQATDQAFVPQLVMHPSANHFRPDVYPDKIDDHIRIFLIDHGFNGFHVRVGVEWFDIEALNWDDVGENPFPDRRTFEAYDSLIVKTHRAGGMVHFWMWGDDESKNTITKWKYESAVSMRLLRYVAARLGPLPGWSMGYGYDNDEWTDAMELKFWHDSLHAWLGWPHLLGARSEGPNTSADSVSQLYEGLDYSGYEQHHPNHDDYVRVIDERPGKPAFSEDRFRVRRYADKDYNEQQTVRGMYHALFAGGVANIWGNLLPSATPGYGSQPYDLLNMIKRYSEFARPRFMFDMVRAASLTDGIGLKRPENQHYLFYKENTSALQMNLSGMNGPQYAIAMDAMKDSAYAVHHIGWLEAENQTWMPPYESDWAVAVGNFGVGGRLYAKVFLQGPYASGAMSAALDRSDEIPLHSPYADAPRRVETVPEDAVDWVLIRLRQTASGGDIALKSVFLRSDGMLMDADGSTEIFMRVDPATYYLIVEHRNHLRVMSAERVRLW